VKKCVTKVEREIGGKKTCRVSKKRGTLSQTPDGGARKEKQSLEGKNLPPGRNVGSGGKKELRTKREEAKGTIT